MKKGKPYVAILMPGLLFLLLIIGSKTAAKGAAEGITQCMQVIIPSLFPFFFASCWLNSKLTGILLPPLNLSRKLLAQPQGSESIFLMGLLGGYPVGATAIKNAYSHNAITRETAHILLGYCNNAGPAFIFGVSHILFSSNWIPWIVWGIQIISSIITGFLLPKSSESIAKISVRNGTTMTQALQKSISITGVVCGWILLFKVLLYTLGQLIFIQKQLPYFSGFLELSNGTMMLAGTLPLSLRFILFSVFLCAGGLCVYFQTTTAVGTLGTGLYVPGKCIQTAVCFLISLPIALLIWGKLPISIPTLLFFITICLVIILLLTVKCRKTSGNCEFNRV